MLFDHVQTIPQGFATDEFVLRPLTVGDVELDYEAVMASRVFLRPWEQTGWPADDFTIDEDRADLEDLEQRQRERRSFTYTVLNPEGTECLGCVYFMPPDAKSYTKARIIPEHGHDWGDVDATLSFWVRSSRLGDGLDRRLLERVRAWIADEWELGRVVVMTNEQVEQQVALYASMGLTLAFRLERDDQDGAYLAYD